MSFTKLFCFICNNYTESKKHLYLEILKSCAARVLESSIAMATDRQQSWEGERFLVSHLVWLIYSHSPRYRKLDTPLC